MKKLRIPDDAMEYFRKTGSIGGKARAKKYTKEQLSEMGKKGGRPKGSGKKRAKKGGKLWHFTSVAVCTGLVSYTQEREFRSRRRPQVRQWPGLAKGTTGTGLKGSMLARQPR